MNIPIRQIKEYKHFMFFIESHEMSDKLIQYNIINKKKHIILISKFVYNYYIFQSNFIVIFMDYVEQIYLYWDICYHISNFGNKGNESRLYLINNLCFADPLFVENELYMIFRSSSDNIFNIYNYDGFVWKNESYRWGNISDDGKRIILFNKDNTIYIKYINNFKLLFYLPRFDIKLWYFDLISHAQWIHSNYLIGFIKEPNIEKYHIYNLNTNECLVIDILNYNFKKYIIDGYLLIINNINQQVSIYDIGTLKLLFSQNYNLDIVGVNNVLNVLITADLLCFKINDQFQFVKANIGLNYAIDCDMISMRIKYLMDIVFKLVDLPPEILNIELYQQIVLFLD